MRAVSPAALGAGIARGTPRPVPLRGSADGLTILGGGTGRPVLLQGDSAWSAINNLTLSEWIAYLDDRRARGFNALLMESVDKYFCPAAQGAPNNRAGQAPFTTANDFATPNDAFWDNARDFVAAARDRGFTSWLAPIYFGSGAGVEGWYSTFAANGTTKVQNFCAYLANKMAGLDNVVWLLGGDYLPPDAVYGNAMWAGISSVLPNAPVSTNWSRGNNSPARTGSWPLTFSASYPAPPVHTSVQAIYGGGAPTYMVEGYYENGTAGTNRALMREQNYASVLNGANGAFFGNGPMWWFGVSGDGNPGWSFANNTALSWTDWLNSNGTQDTTRWGDFFRARRWWDLVPDTSNTLVIAGKGSGSSYVSAARTSDGRLAACYLQAGGSVTLNTGTLACAQGVPMVARWFDTSSGAYTTIATYTTGGLRAYTPPGTQSDGSSDWVLVIEA